MNKILPITLAFVMASNAISCTNNTKPVDTYKYRETKIEAQHVPVLYSKEAYNKIRTLEDKEYDPFCDMVYGHIGSLYFFDVDDKIYIATISAPISKTFNFKRSIKVYGYNGNDENICEKAPYKIIDNSEIITENNFFGEFSDFKIVDSEEPELGLHFNATQKNIFDNEETIDEIVLRLY